MDMIVYVWDRESDTKEPGMLIVAKNDQLRFHAPAGGRYSETASRLNNRVLALDPSQVVETLEDMADRFNGQASLAEVEELKGKHLRRYETLTRKWRAKR